MMNKFYLTLSGLMIGYYGLATYNGWEYGNPRRQVVPADMRQSKGWYRSTPHTHIWSSGYRGGK